MLLSIDPSAPLPVYEQIRSQLATMIASGALEPGDRLPTIRQLCDDLGIAKATVSKAYEQLIRDGYLVANRRQGTVVAEHPASQLGARARQARLREAAVQYALAARQLGFDDEHAIDALRIASRELGDVAG